MPRKAGSRAAKFPNEITYRGLTPIVDGVETVSNNVNILNYTQGAGNTELERIRRANELILGQDVEESE